ncbi:uncharacterized protein LOC131310591 [Rhododendron vialii]|uniref:uncharacterized protein LOC131310591 n=1 Tax=Rhododendron vialii TaxID=182163 RepID=UPI00265E1EC6|nr:uncharacterized protein LOC131310591 [Rhododendron vialii]
MTVSISHHRCQHRLGFGNLQLGVVRGCPLCKCASNSGDQPEQYHLYDLLTNLSVDPGRHCRWRYCIVRTHANVGNTTEGLCIFLLPPPQTLPELLKRLRQGTFMLCVLRVCVCFLFSCSFG